MAPLVLSSVLSVIVTTLVCHVEGRVDVSDFKGSSKALTRVAFSAGLINNKPSLAIDSPVTFDLLESDVGSSFDLTTFTAPVDGVYYFSFAGKSKNMTVHLKENDVIRRSAAVQDANSNENMASNSVLLLLAADDRITLHLSSYGSDGLIAESTEPGIYVSFSGAVLYDTLTGNVNAFSAAKTANQEDVLIDQPMTFDHIDTQIGDGFDSTTYVVTTTGVYLFTFAGKGDFMVVHLKVNGNTKRSAIVEDTGKYPENVAAGSVVLILGVGDQVTAEIGGWAQEINHTSPSGGIFISFSGVLLYESGQSLDGPVQSLATSPIFSATRTLDMDPVTTDTIVQFNQVETNIGLAFDGVSTFTAPSTGHYLFVFSVKSRQAAVHLKVNGIKKRSLILDDDNSWDQSCENSVIMFLDSGDTVAIYLSAYGSGGIRNTSGSNGIFTSFAGMQLF